MVSRRLALAAFLALGLAACKKEPQEDHTHDHGGGGSPAAVSFRLNFMHGTNAFDMSSTYADGAGHALRFTKLKFYVSNVFLEDDGGTTIAAFNGKVLLFDGAMPTATYDLGTVNGGHIHEVHYSLGLDSATNHADPVLAAYPLNLPDMHWGWNPVAGYIFLAIEARVDGNNDGDVDDAEDIDVVNHCLTDQLRRMDSFVFHEDVSGGTVILEGKLDVSTLVAGLDLLAIPLSMGAGPTNVMAMDNLAAAIDEP